MNATALAISAELATSLAKPVDTRDIVLRHSMLKRVGQSLAHCYHAMTSGYDDPTLSKRLGSGVHSLLLGGAPVVMCPHRRGTKDHAKFVADNDPAAIFLSPKEYDKALGIAHGVKSNRLASQIVYAPGGIYEQTIHWEWLGRKRRTTPDVRNPSMVCELKTTRNANPERFKWDCLRMGYHAQLADQVNAIEASTGHRPREVFLVAVETAPPFVPCSYRLTANDLEFGERLNRGWMERLLVAEETGYWGGYSETVIDLDLPNGDDEVVFADDGGEEVADIDSSAGEQL